MKVSLIIPCYNESKNLPILIKRCEKLIEKDFIEIILVDNGSSDNSSEIIQKSPLIKLVTIRKNIGYGSGILEGLKNATGEILAWTHADLQTDPNDILKGLSFFDSEENPEKIFVKGNRKDRPFMDNFFTWGMSFFETILLNKIMWDINAQPTLFHRSFFEEWSDPPIDFSLDLYAYFMAIHSKMIIKRFPVKFTNRIHGTSNWNINLMGRYRFIKRTLQYSLVLKKRVDLE